MDFIGWPKTPRLLRTMTITEKIDGTNGAIVIAELSGEVYGDKNMLGTATDPDTLQIYGLWAQSRKRMVTPLEDNAGFARWVSDNANTLYLDLGPGRHFGEWWGQGIQRNYGLDEKFFSLFNTGKWFGSEFETPGLDVVPVLYEGPFNMDDVLDELEDLKELGSAAVPGWMDPEGIIIYHHALNGVFKVTYEDLN